MKSLLNLALAAVLSTGVAFVGTQADDKQTDKSAEKPKLEACELGEIHQIHRLGKVWLAGQPSEADFKLAKEKEGLKTVINLRESAELEFDEAKLLKELGINYHHFPFRSPSTLKDEVFDNARKVLNDKQNKPVMMHCASANRVGAIWLAHRVLDEQVPYEQALAEAKKVGLKSADFEAKAKDYIARKSAKK